MHKYSWFARKKIKRKYPRIMDEKCASCSEQYNSVSSLRRPSNSECIHILDPGIELHAREAYARPRIEEGMEVARKGVSRQSRRKGKKKAEDHRHLLAMPSEANLCNAFMQDKAKVSTTQTDGSRLHLRS